MSLWVTVPLVICFLFVVVSELIPEKIRIPRLLRQCFAGAAVVLALYGAWEIAQKSLNRVFAEVAGDGTVLSSRNFPWRLEKGVDTEGNAIYTMIGKEGDLAPITVKANPPVKYEVYKSWSGTTIKLAGSTNSPPEHFRIEVLK
jgi:hypothetical protein